MLGDKQFWIISTSVFNEGLGNDSIKLMPIHQTKIAGHGNKRDAIPFHTSAPPPIFSHRGLILISFGFHRIHPS
jgi:hypothetical protein